MSTVTTDGIETSKDRIDDLINNQQQLGDSPHHHHQSPTSILQQDLTPQTNSTHLPSTSENHHFKLSLSDLNSFIDPKSLKTLSQLGGPEQIARGIGTDTKNGLYDLNSSDPPNQLRAKVFGQNLIPRKPTKSIWSLIWSALQDKVLIVLIIAAVVSLALGIYTTLGTPPKTFTDADGNTVEEPKLDWVEGVAILVAVAIVTLVGSVNDYSKEKQFEKLNAKKEDRSVKVIRANGKETVLPIQDLLVGDVLIINTGDLLPVDGIFLEGFEVKCDESSVTGESDLINKISYERALELAMKKSGQNQVPLQDEVQLGKSDCFMISGSKVVEGYGSYLVTSVGKNSFFGKIMMSLRTETEDTPLQAKLNTLAELIAKIGAAAGLLLFAVLMVKFFVQLKTDPNRSANDKAQSFIQVLIISVTVVVVAVPEGLPLAVTLALAFATRRMTKMNLLVRVLSSCETMANSTVVCTDKTGTLTQNQMTVVAGSVGVHLKFADGSEDSESTQNKSRSSPLIPSKPELDSTGQSSEKLDFSVELKDLNQSLDQSLIEIMNHSICINSTAFEAVNSITGEVEFVGSKTETALLNLAKSQGWNNYKAVRQTAEIIQMIPFSSLRKAMGVVVKLSSGGYRLYLKGASEVLTKLTSHYVLVSNRVMDEENSRGGVLTKEFDSETKDNISRTIIFYANQALRTIALCFRDFDSWPPNRGETLSTGEEDVDYEELVGKGEEGLTLLSLMAIKDPLRPGVTQAVADCARAGVAVKMVTGDNILTARSIASQCGIYTVGGIIMEGPIFRQLTKKEMIDIVPRLQVLARSSPEDKKRLVDYLKHIGEIVAVTGDGTNDGPALKTANVGFSMGISGTEVAKEASDIILMDDNFSSIVQAIMWGRCVNDSVKKFLQFQISVNITAVIITFVTSIASSSETSILTAVQLLWVNLIMDTFAALALATDPATPESLNRKPDHKSANLINLMMWKMIVGQSVYQLVVILVLNFAGAQILGLDNFQDELDRIQKQDELKTLVFNSFVFCQIFNQLNARVLDNSLNVFKGFYKNYYFMAIFLIMLGGQILIVEVGGAAFQVTKIGVRDWLISVIIGLLSLPIATIIKLIPNGWIEKIVYEKMALLKDPNKLEVEIVDLDPKEENDNLSDSDSSKWNPAIDKVRDNLAIFSQIRGGRARSSSFVRRSRNFIMREKGIHTGALMTMVPTLVMTSIGAGWQPQKGGGSLADPASSRPNKSTSKLWSERVEVHPDTDPADPVFIKYGGGGFGRSNDYKPQKGPMVEEAQGMAGKRIKLVDGEM
ncbi:hypothetical protein BY996DRAFT_8463651 [Phakopsora pachyrhizi]|nr:hypothetical protein BY996DRAFT_8463651 [Phakopsora pachyrhizi]